MKNLSLNQMENVEGGAFWGSSYTWGCALSVVALGSSVVLGIVGTVATVGGGVVAAGIVVGAAATIYGNNCSGAEGSAL